jgi:hypothetical protein
MQQIPESEVPKPHLSSFSNNFVPVQPTQGAFFPHQPAVFQQKDYDIQPNARMSFDNFHHGLTQQNYSYPYYQYNQPEMMYDPLLAKKYRFMNENFPKASNYKSDASITETFPHLKDINSTSFDMEQITPDAKFFFMRSSNDDDIHKAIKYERWSSTGPCNTKLSAAYNQYKETRPTEEPQIFFVFSVVNTKNLLGVAKVSSNYNIDDSFAYWLEGDKYKGSFKIKWLFVKDVAFTKIDDPTQEGTALKALKDGSELDLDLGKRILESFTKQDSRPNIFDLFEYMDRREDVVRHLRDNEYQVHSPLTRKPYRNNGYGGGRFMAQGKMNYFNRYNNNNNNNYHNNNNNGVQTNNMQNNTSGTPPNTENGSTTSPDNGDHKVNFQTNYRQQYYNKADGFRTGSKPYYGNYNNNNNSNGNNYQSNSNGNDYPQKPQDLASVFIVKDATVKQGQKKNKQQQKKRSNVNNTNTTSGLNSGSNGFHPGNRRGDDRIDDNFWNAASKLTTKDIPQSDDEDELPPKFVNSLPEPVEQQ